MQVWVLSDEQIFEALQKKLEKEGLSLSTEHHGLGFKTTLATRMDEPIFGVLLIDSNPLLIFQAIQWIHKKWQVSDFVNFDSITALNPKVFSGQDYLISIPKRCLRSAGRGDLQTGPLLYEEMAFSESVQIGLATRYHGDIAMLTDPQLSIFSGLGLEHDINFERTIVENANCLAWDTVSGEVLQSCRRLAVRAGALYVVSTRHEYRLGALDAFLRQRSIVD